MSDFIGIVIALFIGWAMATSAVAGDAPGWARGVLVLGAFCFFQMAVEDAREIGRERRRQEREKGESG